ncbi:alpha/beta fold hydrolase [Halarcobacter ebronensis]|uniref:2-hydroxy-6-oxohepta-2,4-dienoate hydrolase n=1 Tax=Halarcobacter ebronensis TaxID=1462615 RepID=A0A4Q1AEF2_9BACT|nr:alpha/beta hydrolase [Halarcobacter ebronensis]QKF81421.1 alpha/beta hydrolase family protein [Halarcobacter ebronensis]RXK01819.1 2-hydroxy-6-oxohepta-2,4-dienoate hydrolase [Halarcobacter ebronensis]
MALKSIKIDNKEFDISYEILNPNQEKCILFLHGWGSNKEIMKQAFSPFLKEFKHIYLDMPGFGKSSNEYTLNTKEYAKIVKTFLEILNFEVVAIAGHSFGGKVATLLNPDNLILLSTAGILEEKPLKVKVKIFLAKLLKSLGLGKLTKAFRSKDVEKMSENMYGTFKNVVNEDFSAHFISYEKNGMIFWGEEDSATSLSAGKEIHSLIKNSSFDSYKDGHYFFLKYAQNISSKIEKGIK